jgi:hypothetical protein
VTGLGLEVTETYTTKEAHLSEGIYQFELLDAKGDVIWSGAGDSALNRLSVPWLPGRSWCLDERISTA